MKRLLFGVLIIICSTFSIAQNSYIVTGAPLTEFNGNYVETGTENGKPYYLLGSTYKISYMSTGDTGGQWMISRLDTMFFSWMRQYMVIQNTPTDRPPQNGWTDGSGAAIPGLHVTGSGITFTAATAATGVHSTSAVLNGTVTSSIASTYHFAYGNSASSLTSSTVETDVSAGTSVPVSAAVTGLTTQTLYYYALVATNANGTFTSSTASVFVQGSVYIVTGAPLTEFNGNYVETGTENGKPYYLLGSTYKISYMSTGDTGGQWMISRLDTMFFEWVPQYMLFQNTHSNRPPQTGWTDGWGTVVPGLSVAEEQAYKISYMSNGATEGEWRISRLDTTVFMWIGQYMVIQDTPTDTPPQTGWTDGSGAAIPGLHVTGSGITVTSVTAATGVLSTSAVLNGTVTSSIATTYHFAYGTSASSLTSSTVETDVSIGASVPVSAAVTGLTTQTLYYYALVATNANGPVTSNTALVYMQGSVPTSNLKMWLRADQQVTTSSSAVTNWGGYFR
jgi:hypothetical protein